MTIHRCPKCGRKTRAEVCRKCKSAAFHDLGLPPGDWVLRGNTRVWEPAPSPDSPIDILPHIMRGILSQLERPIGRRICHCGCLVLGSEDCPMCLWDSLKTDTKEAA